MPTYDYECDCGLNFECVKKVAERHSATCSCGKEAKHIISACHFDPRMGVDPAFPTFASKWDKKHRALQTGRMRDANQTSYGTTIDVEREAHTLRNSGA